MCGYQTSANLAARSRAGTVLPSTQIGVRPGAAADGLTAIRSIVKCRPVNVSGRVESRTASSTSSVSVVISPRWAKSTSSASNSSRSQPVPTPRSNRPSASVVRAPADFAHSSGCHADP